MLDKLLKFAKHLDWLGYSRGGTNVRDSMSSNG